MAEDRDDAEALDRLLAPYFDAAREDAAGPPPRSLLERIAEDAGRVLDEPRDAGAGPARPRGRLDRGVFAMAAGLAAAAILGLWIGFNPPSAVGNIETALLSVGASATGTGDTAGADEFSLLPDIDGLLAEG